MVRFIKKSCLFFFLLLGSFNEAYGGIREQLCALDLLYSYQFEQLDSVVDSLKAEEDTHIINFLNATKFWWYVSANPYKENYYDELMSYTKRIVDGLSRQKVKSAHDYLLLGGAYGYWGRYYLLHDGWMSAYRFGKKGIHYLEQIPQDSEFYADAQFGIGIYRYYVGLLPQYVKVLAFLLGFKGNREEGLDKLMFAKNDGVYSKVEAALFLAFIYIHFESNYPKAIEILESLQQKYPRNTQICILLSNAYIRSGKPGKAVQVCEQLGGDGLATFIDDVEASEFQFTMGFAYQNNHEFNRALAHYDLGEEKCQNEVIFQRAPWKFYQIACCYEMIQNDSQAIFYYQKVLECDDAFGFHEKAKEKLEQYQLAL